MTYSLGRHHPEEASFQKPEKDCYARATVGGIRPPRRRITSAEIATKIRQELERWGYYKPLRDDSEGNSDQMDGNIRPDALRSSTIDLPRLWEQVTRSWPHKVQASLSEAISPKPGTGQIVKSFRVPRLAS